MLLYKNQVKSEAIWRKKRLDKILVDYFLRNSYYETALEVVKSSCIEVHLTINSILYY